MLGSERETKDALNVFGYLGALVSHWLVFYGFGIASAFLPVFLFLLSLQLILDLNIYTQIRRAANFFINVGFWTITLIGFILIYSKPTADYTYLAGAVGYETAMLLQDFLGWFAPVVLVAWAFIWVMFFYGWVPQVQVPFLSKWAANREPLNPIKPKGAASDRIVEVAESPGTVDLPQDDIDVLDVLQHELAGEPIDEITSVSDSEEDDEPVALTPLPPKLKENIGLSFEVNVPVADVPIEEVPRDEETKLEVAEPVVEAAAFQIEQYDPTLDLPRYQYPGLDLLRQVDPNAGAQVTQEELEGNKDRIVETLSNYQITIASIKATVGPTVTLYEIVPDAGIRIAKIKNLEDDIALSLAALGIRIIAPIPGKGTIGIEVPNKKRETVNARSVVGIERFMKSEFELPIILGKTISNEVHIADLASLPHLLIAGATGQGKSVGLNIILASLLYKKHPSQLKLVLVDPKKVELSLFNKLEKHFLATIPDAEEPIITDNKKVLKTLNALCVEMDIRYSMLKDASAKNILEYNSKFVNRKLSPDKGHRFLPYIVLVIDELADLMMTSGKEVETPIARLAQLARAVGIHLIVATQRPSVNVITGIIKANFPARLSFRVISKVDSRTILDTGGAEQLVGMGDMLFSHNSNMIRLQCPFISTSEVENLVNFIGEQRGMDEAYLLPEVEEPESGSSKDASDLSKIDPLFREAATIIVSAAQGSTSLIQRKLSLGYNRAGKLMDQLEAAGIVGPQVGSKPREVYISDLSTLDEICRKLGV